MGLVHGGRPGPRSWLRAEEYAAGSSNPTGTCTGARHGPIDDRRGVI